MTKTELKHKWIEENGPCKICNSDIELHVHHEDPGKKTSHNLWGLSKDKREVELQGCIVLCKECHIDEHTKMRRSGKKVDYYKDQKKIICRQCGKEKPNKGKGLCDSCYRKEQRLNNPIICEDCGKEKPSYTKTLCNGCYSKKARKNPNQRRMIICKECGEERYHEAKGMCVVCYKKYHNLFAPKMVVCLECEENKRHHSGGLCTACFMRKRRLLKKNPK